MTIQRNIAFVLSIVAVAACNRQSDTTPSEREQRTAPEAVVDRDREARDTPRVNTPDVDRDRARDDTAAPMVPASRVLPAAESIADARCAREQKCNNIGADKRYSSMSDCLARIRNDWKDDLNARECPNGVDQKELNECLSEIRNENCGNPFDTLGRVAACTAAQICEDDNDARDRTTNDRAK
jgi:hypothetical protein